MKKFLSARKKKAIISAVAAQIFLNRLNILSALTIFKMPVQVFIHTETEPIRKIQIFLKKFFKAGKM